MTPTGAVAVQGQITASFSGDVTGSGAITLATPSGQVFQSHPIGLFYADSASGRVAQIGLVQSGEGLFYAPNVIVFTNVLSGLNADLMLVWTKEGFEQNLVIKQAPPAPESFGLSSASSRLQMWTAMDQCPAPIEDRPAALPSGLVDHILVFADCWFPVGCAFAFGAAPLPPAGQAAAIRPALPSDTNAVLTAKSLANIAGQQVLIEEVNYTDLLTAFSGLSQAALSPGGARAVELAARGQLLPPPSKARPQAPPLVLASAPYEARGVVLDYIVFNGGVSSYTFTNTTYYVSGSATVGSGGAVFQAGACLKLASNACLWVQGGPVNFPASGTPVVFTSKDDNSYGQQITGSTAQPYYAASPDLSIYFPSSGSGCSIQDALFRWAFTGVAYAISAGVSPTLSSSAFDDCQYGVNVYIGGNTLSISSSDCSSGAATASLYRSTSYWTRSIRNSIFLSKK